MNVLYYIVHPDLNRSFANKSILDALPNHPNLKIVDLYDTYPNFSINGPVERECLDWADAVFFQHPFYWYSIPALLKQWFEIVLEFGYAYGKSANALAGKRWQHIISTGGNINTYLGGSANPYDIEEYFRPLQSTCKLCRCEWQPPLVNFNAKQASAEELEAFNKKVVNTIAQLIGEPLAIIDK